MNFVIELSNGVDWKHMLEFKCKHIKLDGSILTF